MIGCGDYSNGFKLFTCGPCDIKLAVAFSCKSRLCLSCSRRKLFSWSVGLEEILHPELDHNQVVFTLPERLRRLLQKKIFDTSRLNQLAAATYREQLNRHGQNRLSEGFEPAMVSTVHKSGNSLNYNPHVHMVISRQLVHPKTGEISKPVYVSYREIRILWQRRLLNYLLRKSIITHEEYDYIFTSFKGGFNVYFQPIPPGDARALFSTVSYIADGFFHNSQITAVDEDRKTITFKYRSNIDPHSREKYFKEMTLDIFEFMARMLFFLPPKHSKTIRYYGFYKKQKTDLERLKTKTAWARAIEYCFETQPEKCPKCKRPMRMVNLMPAVADRHLFKLLKRYFFKDGYYYRKMRCPG